MTQCVSFSSDFSTVARTIRHAALSTEIQAVDADGKDPLPKELAKATVTLSKFSADSRMAYEYSGRDARLHPRPP